MNHSTEDILNLDALTYAIVKSDAFVEAIHEVNGDKIAGLVEDAVNDYDFCEAIGQSMKAEVESLVESAVGEYDFNQMVRDEMPDYGDDITGIEEEMSRLRDEVEDWMNTDLMAEHSTLIQALQEQNKNFFFALAAAEERIKTLEEKNESITDFIRDFYRIVKRSWFSKFKRLFPWLA